MNLGKIWNVDNFEILAPPLTLAKTVLKSYLTDTAGLFQSYISHICTKFCLYLTNISPIILSKSRPYFSPLNLGKIWKSGPPSSQNSLHFELCTFWFSALTSSPPLDFSHNFLGFLVWNASLSNLEWENAERFFYGIHIYKKFTKLKNNHRKSRSFYPRWVAFF